MLDSIQPIGGFGRSDGFDIDGVGVRGESLEIGWIGGEHGRSWFGESDDERVDDRAAPGTSAELSGSSRRRLG